MKHRLLSFWVGLLAVLAWPAMALAEEGSKKLDPRLDGYTQKLALEDKSTALTWMLLLFLLIVCVAVLCKNAKRTHLD